MSERSFLDEYSKKLLERGVSVTLLSQNGVEEQDVKMLYSFLRSNPTEWYVLGRCLDIPKGDLDVLKVDAHSEYTRIIQVLDKWLASTPEPTYLKLLEAVFLAGKFESFIIDVIEFLSKTFQTERPMKITHCKFVWI